MNPQQLVAHALTRSVKLNRGQAAAIIAHHGAGAGEQIERAGALMDLAGALGRTLDVGAALILLERADQDYDLAAQTLIDDIRTRVQNAFNAEYTRLEKRFWSREAKARHAHFICEVDAGSLGWQAAILLLAVEDAGLCNPDAKAYRKSLSAVVSAEMGRRFPERREAHVRVIDGGYQETLERHNGTADSLHGTLLAAAIKDEEEARELVTKRNPHLEQQINALRSPGLIRDVTIILTKMRKRLQTQAVQHGWTPNVEAYRKHVIEAAKIYAWNAA